MTHMQVFLLGIVAMLVIAIIFGFITGVADIGYTLRAALFYGVGILNSYLYAEKK